MFVRYLLLVLTTLPGIYSAPVRVCTYKGNTYEPGETIHDEKTEYGQICRGIYCNRNGILVTYTIWNCKRTLKTTTEHFTTQCYGCEENGVCYGPGETISSGQSDNHCYGSYCDDDGEEIIYWDDWTCNGKFTTPKTKTTTNPFLTGGRTSTVESSTVA